ncbi:hypothetical protein P792_08810 [Asaia sp. SF2.1]|nr:hypothetical protein P792_08810 [Asaia sp. SF2.1]
MRLYHDIRREAPAVARDTAYDSAIVMARERI